MIVPSNPGSTGCDLYHVGCIMLIESFARQSRLSLHLETTCSLSKPQQSSKLNSRTFHIRRIIAARNQEKGRAPQIAAQHLPSPGESGGPNDWKALAPTILDSVPVGMLRWGAAGGVLGVFSQGMADGAHVLAETVLHRHLRC